MRTKKKVDIQALADALADYPYAYLVTVDDEYRVHTVTVEPQLREAALDVGLIGGRTRNNLAQRADVTLLWPPAEPGGYSLIVDGTADVTEAGAETARLTVVPTRALLHRDADSPDAAKGCLHDCVVFSLPA
ncbi:pyridoxamine 5'-phosphate oxidase family protein [Mycobacterium sp. MUNTM1]